MTTATVFDTLPLEYQAVLEQAQERYQIQITPFAGTARWADRCQAAAGEHPWCGADEGGARRASLQDGLWALLGGFGLTTNPPGGIYLDDIVNYLGKSGE